jgi:hypothetical protein
MKVWKPGAARITKWEQFTSRETVEFLHIPRTGMKFWGDHLGEHIIDSCVGWRVARLNIRRG